MTQPTAIYLDATETYFSGLNTGIQRVVRSLADRSAIIGGRLGCPCVPVVWWGNRFISAEVLLNITYRRDRLSALETALNAVAIAIRDRFERWFSRRSFAFRTARVVWRKLHIGLVHGLTLLRRHTFHWLTRIDLRPSDVLVLTDAFWGISGRHAAQAAAEAAETGVRIILVAYDLFPLTDPHLVAEDTIAPFQEWFPRTCELAEGIVTISHAMAHQIQEHLRTELPPLNELPLAVFHLGGDFSKLQDHPRHPTRPEIARLAAQPYALTVGTLEPRKGYTHLLDAFDIHSKGDPRFTLCIVGRVGWKCERELDRIRTHALFNQRLFFFHDANDTELALLYRHSRMIVLPSLAEGFGLPMVEAMGMGARVIANDIPIFREVGGGYPLYYTRTGAQLSLAIAEMERRIASGDRPLPRTWLTWDDAARQFADAVSSVLRRQLASAAD